MKEEDFLRILVHCLGEHHDNSTDKAKSYDIPCDKKKIEPQYSQNGSKLVQIFKNLSNLKKLVLKGMSFPRGIDECLSHLPNLEYHDTTDSDFPTKHLADGIVKPLNILNFENCCLTDED